MTGFASVHACDVWFCVVLFGTCASRDASERSMCAGNIATMSVKCTALDDHHDPTLKVFSVSSLMTSTSQIARTKDQHIFMDRTIKFDSPVRIHEVDFGDVHVKHNGWRYSFAIPKLSDGENGQELAIVRMGSTYRYTVPGGAVISALRMLAVAEFDQYQGEGSEVEAYFSGTVRIRMFKAKEEVKLMPVPAQGALQRDLLKWMTEQHAGESFASLLTSFSDG